MAKRTEVGAQRLTGTFPTVARSPVVVALPADRASAVRWPERGAPITALLGQSGESSVALPNPIQDTAGLATVLQVGAAAPTGSGTAAVAEFARRVRVPSSGDQLKQVAAGQLGAVTTTEREVVRYNRAAAASAQVSAYAGAAPPGADVPLVRIRPTDGARAVDAIDATEKALRDALLGEPGQARLRAAGFRDQAGRLDSRYPPVTPLSATRLPDVTAPDDDAVRSVVRAWSTLGRRGRVLVAVDSSGSMAARLRGASTTKSRLGQRALTAVVKSIAPDSDMGLWSFTASRGRDYRVLVPLGPADGRVHGTSRRQALLRSIPAVKPVRFGGTGLYDTTLAAFRAASQDYAYGRLNAVLLVTDGLNQDPGSVSLKQLLSALRREFDGIKPVRIITVAYGNDADLGVLRRIADVTGGASYQAVSAPEVAPILAKTLADL